MIEALRGLGYSTATALADIIDNSIAADASRVDVIFHWDGARSHIRIFDDGRGMSPEQLDSAMRLGERNPLEERCASDLGRFGLGLKTASFSQARRLTVASSRNGRIDCLRWDLDMLASNADGGWFIVEGTHPGSEPLLAPLEGARTGTLVLWEVMDRVVSPGVTSQGFHDLIDAIEGHLGMVFHRYLEGPQPRLRLFINGRPVEPWDPFLQNHPATHCSPVAHYGEGRWRVDAQAFVLPHKDLLAPAVYDRASGPDGWTVQQGFYVYRNERLLLAGSWLGLGSSRAWAKEEPYRLARLRIDLPNTSDADWKIDIRKSTARPPASLRPGLTHLAEDTRARARRVFAHRGKMEPRQTGQPIQQAWSAEHGKAGVRYRIDSGHPAVAAVLEQAGSLADEVRAMLRVIEETVPVQRIWLDTAEAREVPNTRFSAEAPAEVLEILLVMFRNLTSRKGLSSAAAVERLLRTEPFDDFPELVAAVAHAATREEIQP